LAKLPRSLSDEQVRALLAAFDKSTATGLRDHAIALCFLELGLRAGEVAAIELDDIDWEAGTLRIAEGKSHRGRMLPLPKASGRAIVSYLRKGRPATLTRSLFVRHRVPAGKAMAAELVRGAMRRAYAKGGLPAEWTGTHLLRHTAATRMIQGGASLKQIADVLGHQSIDTTMIYTKVDVPALRMVSMPWPEVES
jgi:site-specific recombinase XerD